jgi:hypothetical protein
VWLSRLVCATCRFASLSVCMCFLRVRRVCFESEEGERTTTVDVAYFLSSLK